MQNMRITGKRTLIIDADSTDRTVMAAFLRSENFQVETVTSLVEAIKKVSDHDFDCLIMDVDLPEMKGYEAISVLKTIDPNLTIIMTAKKNTKELETKIREQNIFFYFIKSFKKEELKQALKSALRIKEVNQMEKQRKILIIDDDPDFRDAVTTILESAHYDVATASDPKQGTDKLFEEKPDLILLDIMMDSLFDGFSLCHKIKTGKEFEKFRNVPIIFCSAVKEQTGSRFEFKGGEVGMVGPDDYLDKPVNPRELIEHIEKLLNSNN
jgi:CheY-like chemotaxis protein